MHFKLAILTALSRRPDGRATLDDIRREVEALTANEDRGEEQPQPLADIDIFQSGLVVPEGDELQITEVGRSQLHALGTFIETYLPPISPPSSKSLKLIDELIGTGKRMKIFDLELRKPHEQTDLGPSQPPASYGSEDAETSAADARVTADGRPEIVAPPISLRPDREQAFSQNIKPIAIDPADRSSLQAPAFLKRSFSSKLQTNAPKISRREDLVNAIVARLERARSFWRAIWYGMYRAQRPRAEAQGSAGERLRS